MNRELKFRARRKDNGQWAYGYFVKTPITTEFNCDGMFLDSGGVGRYCIIQDNVAHEIDIETLGQFTCLKDRNGTEIYKGDILKLLTHYPHDYQQRNPHKKQGRIYGPVAWEDGWLFSDKKERNGIEDELLYKEISEQFEVVGNIYENPELLK